MKTRKTLLTVLLILVAGAAAAIPTATVPMDPATLPVDLLERSPALTGLGFLETQSEAPLQISQAAPWPCDDDPFGPIFILIPLGPTTGPFDPTQCLPFPWPFPI